MHRHLLAFLAVVAAGLPAALPAASATVEPGTFNPGTFNGLQWRLLGPFRAGRVLAVSGVPGQPKHFYFGAVNGSVWESRDAGRTWNPVFDDQPVGSIGALAVAPSAPNVIYVGTGEADMRSDIAQGDGMYRSRDGGAHWTHIGLEDSQQIGDIVVDPNNADVLYVAALGHPYGPNRQRGVFKSVDGGAHWSKVLYKDENTGAIDLALAPDDPNTLYAALWQTRRPPWNVYPPSSGPGSGLYKSADGGETWTQVQGAGFPQNVGRIGIGVAPNDPQRVYAIVDADKGGLYRSDDAGNTWQWLSDDDRIWDRGWYFGGVTVDPRDRDSVYVMNTAMYHSGDGGAHFVPVKGSPGGDDYHTLWIDPRNPEHRILGVDQGAVVTLNGGRTWSSWYNQPTAQFYNVNTDNRFPYWVYGAQQDSGAVGLPSRTTTRDGINLMQFHETTAGGESDNIAPDPDDPQIIYGGRVVKLDLRTAQTRDIDPTLAHPDNYRRTWTLPLVFSHRDSDVLYFANQRLFRTADGGEHWAPISGDLTREQPKVPDNLDAPTVADNLGTGPRRGVIYAIAPSRTADHDIWVGTDDGLLWRTRDEGRHWDSITPKDLDAWSKVGMIETSPFDADTAYAAIDRHRLDDFAPYVYRTHDGGKHWKRAADGIPQNQPVNAVREDDVRKGLLYAGTEKGVYVSFDNGDHWQPLQLNLPVTSVRDIEVHGEDVVIATHGRGFWVLDDVAALRQVDARVQKAQAWLYKPAVTYRVRPAGFTGTPLPQDEPRAENPPLGAYIDYVLKAAPKQPLIVSIYDADGALVRRYSSADAAPKVDTARIQVAPEWEQPPQPPASTQGMHRFVWDLHYAAPEDLLKHNGEAEGSWAPPGNYTVELDTGGRKLVQPLMVKADPRVHLPAKAYAQQFAFAQKVQTMQARLAVAQGQAQAVHKQLGAARAQVGDDDLASAIDALDAKVVDAAGILEAPNHYNAWSKPPKTTMSFRFLEDAFSALYAAVDGGADAAPSPDARAGYAALKAKLDRALAQWQSLKTNELPALNANLRAAGVARVTAETHGGK